MHLKNYSEIQVIVQKYSHNGSILLKQYQLIIN